jgi:hypothetical protein
MRRDDATFVKTTFQAPSAGRHLRERRIEGSAIDARLSSGNDFHSGTEARLLVEREITSRGG